MNKTIFALGYFDGVHLGHQALLHACRQMAAQSGCRSGAVTFCGHPERLVKGTAPALITTEADRKDLLSRQVDSVLELSFDQKLMDTPWEQFLAQLITEYGAAGFVCGSDFRFGQKGTGTAALLQQFCAGEGLSCQIVPQKMLQNIRISSTHIRYLIESGDLETAGKFLGHPFTISGQVVTGKQLGRTIGFPTANLDYPEQLVRLPKGVYACRVTTDGKTYTAVTNVGNRPTVNGISVNIEAWLQDFSGDLYGKTITVSFYKFIRPEQKFPDLLALRNQIQKDKNIVKKCIDNL